MKNSKNVDFIQILEKFRFWSNFRKISILIIIFEKKFEKITILDKIGENFSKNVDFSQIFKDIWFWSKFIETDFFLKIRKISILFKFWKIFDCGQNLRKMAIFFSKISNKFRFKSNFRKKLDLGKIFEKNLDLGQIFWKNFDFV